MTAYATADGDVRWQQSGGCNSIVQANGVLYRAAISGPSSATHAPVSPVAEDRRSRSRRAARGSEERSLCHGDGAPTRARRRDGGTGAEQDRRPADGLDQAWAHGSSTVGVRPIGCQTERRAAHAT